MIALYIIRRHGVGSVFCGSMPWDGFFFRVGECLD
ncbi:hypothetical protein APH_0204 [Anaplasma phagocytophilum str. HZ]|uniref:Uncharacterized protein n=1 Tax=Anaplasma phagocytophilum (strain HZ) TaxID=212042 RepID=Q2GLC5_ANAPZ|nr:hypothetical protein APH_0204 [Anaplasma phagocytophilum str. HZ]